MKCYNLYNNHDQYVPTIGSWIKEVTLFLKWSFNPTWPGWTNSSSTAKTQFYLKQGWHKKYYECRDYESVHNSLFLAVPSRKCLRVGMKLNSQSFVLYLHNAFTIVWEYWKLLMIFNLMKNTATFICLLLKK